MSFINSAWCAYARDGNAITSKIDIGKIVDEEYFLIIGCRVDFLGYAENFLKVACLIHKLLYGNHSTKIVNGKWAAFRAFF